MKETTQKGLHTTRFELNDIVKKANYEDSERVRGCRGLKGEGVSGRSQKEFRQRNYPVCCSVVGTRHCTFVHTQATHRSMNGTSCEPWTLVMTCELALLMVDNGLFRCRVWTGWWGTSEAVCMLREAVQGAVLSPQFYCDPKTALKHSLAEKNQRTSVGSQANEKRKTLTSKR